MFFGHFRRLNLCLNCFGIQHLKSETKDFQDIWWTTVLKENLNLRSKYYGMVDEMKDF